MSLRGYWRLRGCSWGEGVGIGFLVVSGWGGVGFVPTRGWTGDAVLRG